MAKKKKETAFDEIKKNLGTKKVTIGTSSTLKALRKSGVKKIFLTKNVPNKVKEELAHYSKIGKADLIELEVTNEELGNMCKKRFSISVIGLRG